MGECESRLSLVGLCRWDPDPHRLGHLRVTLDIEKSDKKHYNYPFFGGPTILYYTVCMWLRLNTKKNIHLLILHCFVNNYTVTSGTVFASAYGNINTFLLVKNPDLFPVPLS